MTKHARQEPVPDLIQRYKRVIIAVSIPMLIVSFVLFVMPRSPPAPAPATSEELSVVRGRKAAPGGLGLGSGSEARSYAVIFDAGSSGSRVHVYCFDANLDLVHFGTELEVFVQKKPGLSAYAKDPEEAAESLVSLLEVAESTVPVELQHSTPVRVGATAGLRLLGLETAEKILQAVRNLLHDKSSLKSQPDWVSVLDGTQEAAYQWVTVNYLLGRLGKNYSETVGVVDLGGGSVQMAYAISESDAAKAPRPPAGEEKYVKELFVKGTKYYLYVHSYLHYGLLAARAEILKIADGSSSNCILGGYHGSYKYGDQEFLASASPSGASFSECRSDVDKALKVAEQCTYQNCSFGGVWNGGDGDGEKNLFVGSFFFDRAVQAGFVDSSLKEAKAKASDFEEAAKHACKQSLEEAKATYPRVEEANLPFLCMDLTYQFTLLVDGFGLELGQEFTLVREVKYRDAFVDAAWPLGSAIELISSGSAIEVASSA